MIKTLIIAASFFLSFSCSSDRKQGEGFVSLSPSATEIIYKLGVEGQLKAVSDYCDWPPAAGEKPSAGGIINPSLEKIISLNPETVFTLAGIPGQIKNSLEENGIKVIETNSDGLEGVYSDIERIARLSGRVEEGKMLIYGIKKDIEQITRRVSGSSKRVYAEISANPVMSPGKKSHINAMIELAGGINVSASENTGYVLSGIEYIISQKPDIILILSEAERKRVDDLKGSLKDSVPAVAEGNIYYVENKDIILRPGPRIGEGIKEIARYISTDKEDEK